MYGIKEYLIKKDANAYEKADFVYRKLYGRTDQTKKGKIYEFNELRCRLDKISGKKKKQEEANQLSREIETLKLEIQALEKKMEAFESLHRKYYLRRSYEDGILYDEVEKQICKDEKFQEVSKVLCDTFKIEFAEEIEKTRKEIEEDKAQEEKDNEIIDDLENILK